ncbi:MAG: PD-(D/E)XK nuclease family protein [Ruminococcus sp.]
MLNIIAGNSGTGKTTYLLGLLADMVRKGEDKILFIVPDQSSFDTEKTFLEMLGPKDSLKIKVMGFTRLCDYIFSVNGSNGKVTLDEGSKAILMSLALNECADNMPLFSGTKNKNELISLMLSAVSEYKTCNIMSEDILETAKHITDETLKEKLKETSLVMDAFNMLVNKSYLDPDDYVITGLNSLKENNIFSDYIIALDSFSGFTNAELMLLEKLMSDSREFFISLTTDCQNNNELFFTTERTIRQLKKIAKNNNVKISSIKKLSEDVRFQNKDLIPILHNVYRVEKESFENQPNDILIYECGNKYSESDFVARSIKQLIIEKGYTYDDIAVVFRDENSYDGVIDTTLKKYDIPFFMDKKEDIFSKHLIKLVNSVFDVINTSYNREKILNVLKCGLLSYTQEEISNFENYLLMWDIKGSRFTKPFTDNPRGLVGEFTDGDQNLLDQINSLRESLITPIDRFKALSKDEDSAVITKNLYNLLVTYEIPENIVAMCQTLTNAGEDDFSDEQRRIWDILMNVLDKMYSVLGDKNLTLKEYGELLSLQFIYTEIGYIPRSIDQVVVSGIERVRLTQKKAIFVMGCNEGVFPKTPSSSGIFTDSERKLLIEQGLEVNDSVEELNFKEMYLAYYALTLPSEKLYISYYNSTLKGEALSPSSIIREVTSIYPSVSFADDSIISTSDKLWSENSAFEYTAKSIRTASKTQDALRQYFSQKEKYSEKLKVIEKTVRDEPAKINDQTLAQKLFGKDLYLSASQVEVYHLCKFKYFCQYGLNAKERRPAQMDSLQYGNLMHYLMERFLKEHKKEEYIRFSEGEIASVISEYIEDYAHNELGGIDDKPARFRYLYYRMKDNAVSLLIHIIEELAQSDFQPVAFELGVGKEIPSYNITLDDGTTLSVRGFIDRVDVMEKNNEKFIRVVDYKTGIKEFKIGDILYGLNLQMLIYLSAIKKNGQDYFGENIVPCGVLYQPSSTGFVSADYSATEEEIQKEQNKSLKMSGIILDNTSVILGMDKSGKGTYIPVKIGKNGPTGSKDSLFNLAEMGMIFRNIDELLTQMAETLHRGEIEFNPAMDKYNACQYCPYLSVCGYEEGKNCRQILKLSKEEVMEELKKQEKEESEDAKVD